MPEEVTVVQELPWYAKCSLDDVRCFIGANLKSVARSVVAVGYYLKQVRDRELWKDAEGANYASVWDFALREFGISKSTASRYMSINDRFSEGGDSPLIMERYADLSRSQLQEMLYLTDQQAEAVTHETTVQQIRAMRIPEPGPVEVLEGQMSIEDFDILPQQAEPDSLASGSIVQESAKDARYTAMSDPVGPVVVTVGDLLQDDEQEAAFAISQQEDTEQAPENDHIDEVRLIDANKYLVNDCISRAAAIEAMMKLQTEDIEAYGASIPEGFDGDRAVTALKALPSAQSELENKILAIGYTGKEGRIYIGGRLFAVRELAQ